LPLLAKSSPHYWLLAIGIIFIAVALFLPSQLKHLNIVWMKFGLLLHKIISPLILIILFYLVFTPIAILLRIFKKDVLSLKIYKNKNSYWIKSEQIKNNMRDQF
jgi:membrane-bound ClpP family serine protease